MGARGVPGCGELTPGLVGPKLVLDTWRRMLGGDADSWWRMETNTPDACCLRCQSSGRAYE